MSQVPDTMTVAEAAEAIRKSPRYVRGLIAEGRLKAVRLSERGHWLVFADSIAVLLGVKAQRQHSPEYHLKRDQEILARMGLL
ncbi:MAG: helix-turn-helix domain-containing protein [Phycisphaerae bacterium]|nr:helix-turn-helix domain-containing protein [Phycisphaerae bacterium]